MKISPLAGKPAPNSVLVDVSKLITAYYTEIPDSSIAEERVVFGTSGHRGSSFKKSFNESHILAITQAICEWREANNITGPLYIGKDTHALSEPSYATALEVLGANNVEIMLSENDEYTPTPAISRAILCYNRERKKGFADGIVITPSHNPPDTGGFKYNSSNGGPADLQITNWIEERANKLLKESKEIKRVSLEKVLRASKTHRYNYLRAYIEDLDNVIDMGIIKREKINIGVDPLGGASVNYWEPIAEKYGLDLTLVNHEVDKTFSFMTVDWDGQIRMDPSSSYVMRRIIGIKNQFQIAFGCDTDADRHGIVTGSTGLLPPNHYLSVAILYLFQHRPKWKKKSAIGKTVVSTQMIDKVAKKLKRKLYEVPVGFKWFVDGLFDGSLGFGGEESAGASFLRRDGRVWTTDKDGIIASLLAAEITARMGKDPGELYRGLTDEFGQFFYDRVEFQATVEQKKRLKKLSSHEVESKELAGEKIESILTEAPGNGSSIGGLKVIARNGWFAARPSGTEDIYKIYAESCLGKEHLNRILKEAKLIVDKGIE